MTCPFAGTDLETYDPLPALAKLKPGVPFSGVKGARPIVIQATQRTHLS